MPDEKNHLFGPLDMAKDAKSVNKRKTQQQFSRFSLSLATSVTNANIQATSPAVQTNYKVQIGTPYDDTIGSVSGTITIEFSTDGSQYTFITATNDLEILFDGLPTGRAYEYVVDIEVDNAAGVVLTFPQVTNPPVLDGDDDDRYVLKFVGVNRSDPTGVNPPVETYTFLSGSEGGGGAVSCPVICPENNLGDVSGGVVIDWSLSPFHRMRLVGDIAVAMTNLPTAPGWHEITVEFLQDPVGGWATVFLDVFRNVPLPVVRKGTNQYTIVKFYSYFDGFDNILSWQPNFLVDDGQGAFSGANQGMIHTVLSADQTSNLAVGDHVEFDTILFTNQMGVSVGAGQLSGLFSGFTPGRTYELEAGLGVENSGDNPMSFMSYQWYYIQGATFIGSHGTNTHVNAPLGNWQQQARAFFQPFDGADTVELRILAQAATPIDTVLAGTPTLTDPQSYAIIKDCGQTPQQWVNNQEAAIDEDRVALPPEPPLLGFTGRMMYNQNYINDTYGRASEPAINGEIAWHFEAPGPAGYDSFDVPLNDDTERSREVMCVTPGILRKFVINLSANTLNKAFDIDLMKDDVKQFTLLTIPAATTGQFEWPSVGGQAMTPLLYGSTYYYRWKTTDSLNPTGNFSGWATTEVFWGGA